MPVGRDKLLLTQTVDTVLRDHGYKYIGLDHYTLESDGLYQALQNGKLQRNFQGYTTHADTDLVGLGVSAISTFETAFAQNTISISDYIESLSRKKLPIAKGLELSLDDRIRQKVIQQIMCHGNLDMNITLSTLVDRAGQIPLKQYFKDEIDDLEKFLEEGILILEGSTYHLTESGRYFMRAVAATFDRYLTSTGSASKNVAQFSKAI